MHTRPTQAQRVLEYMEAFGSITQYEAMHELGVMRLAARVMELKKRGHAIDSCTVTVRNRFGEACKVKQYRMGSGESG